MYEFVMGFLSFLSNKDSDKEMLSNNEVIEIINEIKRTFATLDNRGKITLIKYHLKHNSKYDKIMCIILHSISNESTTNQVFSLELIKKYIHYGLFSVARTNKNKWLFYSALWNICRFSDCRNKIRHQFVDKMLEEDLFFHSDNRLQNTYIGCLSNLGLCGNHKNRIADKLMNSNNIDFDMERNSLISLNGLFANLSIDDEIAEKLINSPIYILNLIKLKEHFQNHTDDELLRNSLVFFMNSSDIKDSNKYLIEIDFYETILNLIKNNDIVEECINYFKQIFKIVGDYDETTSLHLSDRFNYKDLILKKIKGDFNINKKDKLGNTILHNALIDGKYDLAKFYILCDANVDIKNNSNYTPRDISSSIVSEALESKESINKTYKVEIQNNFEENCEEYEQGHIEQVFSYINKYDKMYCSTN